MRTYEQMVAINALAMVLLVITALGFVHGIEANDPYTLLASLAGFVGSVYYGLFPYLEV